jgi:hypothetical protein
MPKRNSPSKVARDAKGKPVKGTDAQRRAKAKDSESKGSGETQTPTQESEPQGVQSLNWRQRMFVRCFLGESKGNATDAARKAGYLDPEIAGWRLKQNAAIARALEAAVTEAGMTAEEILDNLTEMATFDATEFMDQWGHLDIRKLIAAGKANMIQAIIPTANGTTYKLYSRKEALELLGKYRKLFIERISLEGFDPASMTEEQLRSIVSAGKGRQGA